MTNKQPEPASTPDSSLEDELRDIIEDLAIGHNFEYAGKAIWKLLARQELKGRIDQVMRDFLGVEQYLDGAEYDESVLIDWRIETVEMLERQLAELEKTE